MDVFGADVDAVAFDAYGTLFDVHAAVAAHAARIGPIASGMSEMWRAKQLEYAWVHGLAGRFVPFWTLTERALDHALARHGLSDANLRADLLGAYRAIPPFPDAAPCLARLRARGVRTAILTNADQAMIDAAVAGAGVTLDEVVSVEDARCYKTAPRAYRLACDRLGCAPERLGFVSSNAWDAAGAAAFGLRCAWLRRTGLPAEYPDFPPAGVATTLDEVG